MVSKVVGRSMPEAKRKTFDPHSPMCDNRPMVGPIAQGMFLGLIFKRLDYTT